MAIRKTESAASLEPEAVEAPAPTPTVTYYQQLAAQFMTAFDELAIIIPKLEAQHVSTVDFVRGHLNIPVAFLATVISGVEQTPELQGVQKLDVAACRDTLQFIDAFRPVHDKLDGFVSSLAFTMNSRKATAAADALQVYDIAKGLARDPNSAALAALVDNMKRDLGRSGGRPKVKKPAPPPAPAAS